MERSEDSSLDKEDTDHADEADEVLVVSLAYACSKPWAVVIKSLDATAAYATVNCPRRSVDVACCAVFHLRQERSVYGQILPSVKAVLCSIVQIVLVCFHQEVSHRDCCWILRCRQYEEHRCHEAKQKTEVEPKCVRRNCVLQVTQCIETQEELNRIDHKESACGLPKVYAKLDSSVGEVQLFAFPIPIFQF